MYGEMKIEMYLLKKKKKQLNTNRRCHLGYDVYCENICNLISGIAIDNLFIH